jgi:CubicO group peptidase (beta-lactamase class C family)/predicted aspartyl protease
MHSTLHPFRFVAVALAVACAAGAAPRPVDPPRATRAVPRTEVPLLRLRGLPVVEVSVNGSIPRRFVIDWGANILAVSPRLVRELHLAKPAGGAGGGEKVAVNEIRIGDDVFEGLTALVDPFFDTSEADGVLGLNLYGDLLATIDYPRGRFRLERAALPKADGKTILDYREHGQEQFTVSVEIAGKTVPAVLDTGASRGLLLPDAAANDFRYREPLAESKDFASGPQAGKYHPREGVLDGPLRIGAFEFPDPPVSLNESPSFLIGAAVLEKFEISLDEKNRRVRLVRKDDSPIRTPRPTAPPAPAVAPVPGTEAKFPATPLGRRVQAYLDAFNSGDDSKMKAFFQENFSSASLNRNSVDEHMTFYGRMKDMDRRFHVERVAEEKDGSLTVLATNAGGEWRKLSFLAEAGAERKLEAFRIEVASPPVGLVPGTGEPSEPPKRSDVEAAAAADALASDLTAQGKFSGAILLARKGRPFFEKAYGLANREFNVACTLETKFNIGSMNKFLTTIAIGQLAAAGKLSLGDTIRRWLPDYRNAYADRVTVAQLVAMKSGMGDMFGPKSERTPPLEIRRLEDYLPLFQEDPLHFEPGTRQEYSNAGFVVLGLIIQKASGEDYYDYVRRHILAPAGMSSTDSFEVDEVVPDRAEGYTMHGPPGKNGEPVARRAIFAHPGRGSSAGGGYSTVGDFLKLDGAFRAGKLLPREWMVWAVSHDDPSKEPVAGEAPALTGGYGFAGGSPGTNAAMLMNFDAGTTVVVFSNLDPPSAEALAKQIRGWLPK